MPEQMQLVVSLDINWTILEGDSLCGEDPVATQPARHLLDELRQVPARVVLYTFGIDSAIAVDLLKEYRETKIKNSYFIARSILGEIWAFPVPGSRCAEDPGSSLIDFSSKNAIISSELPSLADNACNADRDISEEFKRFNNKADFAKFIDGLISEGDVLLRACFDPRNTYFCGRADVPCKVLAASLPIIAFDDHPQDWDLDSPRSQLVRVRTPSAAGGEGTDMIGALRSFLEDASVGSNLHSSDGFQDV